MKHTQLLAHGSLARGLHTLALATSTLTLAACLPGPEAYFPDPALAPALLALESQDERVTLEEGVGVQPGTVSGAALRLKGARLNRPELLVRFGEMPATILRVEGGDGESVVTLQAPQGPIGGGVVEVIASTLEGVSSPLYYEYRLPEAESATHEVGSIVLVGETGDAGTWVKGGASFWPEAAPRAFTTLVPDASLYFRAANLEADAIQGDAVFWPTGGRLPAPPATTSLPSAQLIMFTPQNGSLAPFTLTYDRIQGTFHLCLTEGSSLPAWSPGMSYVFSMDGGALAEPLSRAIQVPARFLNEGDTFPSLRTDEAGVGTVNLKLDLDLSFEKEVTQTDAQALIQAEIVVFVPNTSPPGTPYEVQRLVVEALPSASGLIVPSLDLLALSEVNTTCAVLGAQLEQVRLRGEDDTSAELIYRDAGCATPASPLKTYRYQAMLRLSRHHVYSVPEPTGVAGCATPGACSKDGQIILDLVTTQTFPVNLFNLPISDCADFDDNDQDGLVDEKDPGCRTPEDTSEVDTTGELPCDDLIDNDADGTIDHRPDGSGDPGCDSPADDSEVGTGACDDDRDNDGDGALDYRPLALDADPGCASVKDGTETDPTLPCDDGLDNDGDRYTDFRPQLYQGDPGCLSPLDATEIDESGGWQCDDLVDNDGDGATDEDDLGCRPGGTSQHSPYEPDEYNQGFQCDDGIDNDGDTRIDYRVNGSGDLECTKSTDDTENR